MSEWVDAARRERDPDRAVASARLAGAAAVHALACPLADDPAQTLAWLEGGIAALRQRIRDLAAANPPAALLATNGVRRPAGFVALSQPEDA